MTKRSIVFLACCTGVAFISTFMLGSDSTPFLLWWIAALLIGLLAFPAAARLFPAFADRGWIFSKALGLAVSCYLMFVLGRARILPFTGWACFLCVLIPAAVCFLLFSLQRKKAAAGPLLPKDGFSLDLILLEELIFLAVFLMWTYFTGFNPKALSTEKFMDYGFMAAMMRDTHVPAVDMWHASDGINYYYGGQFFAVFLTKLTGTRVHETYNISKCLIAAFTFVMPFSIGWHLYSGRIAGRKPGFGVSAVAGLLSGGAVSLAGNMHYVLYGLFGSVFKLSGYETYWFPSSTRYIGHNPETADNCIHEFPSYSFVLGDLHAHVVNLVFVLLFLGLLYAWIRKREEKRKLETPLTGDTAGLLKDVFADPYLWLFALLIGMFQWMNYWDFAIYFVVFVIASGLMTFRQNGYSLPEALMCYIMRILALFIGQFLVAAPFLSAFKTMQSGIGLSVYHSAFYQLAILWGLPILSVILLAVYVFSGKAAFDESLVPENAGGLKRVLARMDLSDMTALLFGCCAIGLVLAPEILYVKDIYGEGLSRANTMFKFTYQAYVMFGISMVYALLRLLSDTVRTVVQAGTWFLVFLLLLTCGYFPYSVKCWFGDVGNKEAYLGLDATAYLANEMPEDADAVYWLDKNVEGNPVVLEVNGTSYTTYCRVSAMTGLPTVMGWYTHEWLWRGDTDEINGRNRDISEIYTGSDPERIKTLIEKYDIDYIFVGSCEREDFENLNEQNLRSLGTVVFEGSEGERPAFIVKVARGA